MTTYHATIGLEIHAELKTKTKMFCNSKNDTSETRPNVNVCPICMGHPGTLPTINKEAVRQVVRVGHALNGEIAGFTEFDRKNYFYPDIPKGYQISQYKFPLVSGGELVGVKIRRVHLEEDTARSTHEKGDYSLVDFNRAGIPLMELVTEPVINNGEQAVRFAKELQLILWYLGASDANMEKGEMRVEANVSVAEEGSSQFGTKVEIKNLNSFRSVEKAINYEIERQEKLLRNGEKVIQETRGWDDVADKTFSQRVKEESHDYRYFPDPDLPKLDLSKISELDPEKIKATLPELPSAKRERYKKDFDLQEKDVEFYIYSEIYRSLFEQVTDKISDKDLIKLASNYISSDLAGLAKKDEEHESIRKIQDNIKAQTILDLISMIKDNKLSSRGAKDVLKEVYDAGGDVGQTAKRLNILQESNEAELETLIETIIRDNPSVVVEYKEGKENALQYLVGQGMKVSKGKANPQVLKKIILEKIQKNR